MDKVIPALVVGAISSLTFIAYKHPNAYRKMYILLGVCYIILCSFAAGWQLGSYDTVEAILGYIDPNKLKEAKAVANNYLIQPWTIFASSGLILYFTLLLLLPILLEEDKPKNK
jgi:hypothetical protein